MDLERLLKFKEVFSGSKDQDIEAFFDRFESWCHHHNHDHRYKVRNFIFCLDRRGVRVPQILSKTGGGGLARVWGASDSAELLSMESLKTSLVES